MPQLPAASSIIYGIESVNIIVLRHYENDVMYSVTRNGQVRNIQWLGIHLPRHGIRKQFAERSAVDIRRREDRLVRVESLPRKVVVPRCHVDRQHASRFKSLNAEPRRRTAATPASWRFLVQ